MPEPWRCLRRRAPRDTIRRKPVFRPNSGCDDYPMCEIVAAWDLAGPLVDDAIVAVNDVIAKGAASSHHAKVMARFPAATATQLASVKTTLTSIKAELASNIVAKCVRAGEPCIGNVLAGTTCKANADIDFCSLFNVTDCRNQAAAIIHEIAHHIVCLVSPEIEVTKKRKRQVERDGKTETVEEEFKEKTGRCLSPFPRIREPDHGAGAAKSRQFRRAVPRCLGAQGLLRLRLRHADRQEEVGRDEEAPEVGARGASGRGGAA